jgi:hypothetical protein
LSLLFEEGGDYSEEEIEWYKGMMKELDELCKRSADRRKSKNEELFLLLNKKR